MILRLVYSFFFFSLVTGNEGLEDAQKMARTSPCINKVCVCQDHLDLNNGPHLLPLISAHLQVSPTELELPLKVVETHYGYPAHGLVSHLTNPQAHIETKSVDVEILSDNENPSFQVPRPYVDEDTLYTEKTICFTPRMVHRMVKAALEYVSQMPSDINNIIDKIDQELNRISEPESIEELAIKKPQYPLDSRAIFKMLIKPKSEPIANLILKYELPGAKEPQCREALEKLIEIAYNAYLELEQHPQCRDYLYRFASHQPDDRPKGHLEQGPDLKSMITTILDQIDKLKPNPNDAPEHNRYGDIEVPTQDIPIPHKPHPKIQSPQIHEINIPQIHDITMPQIHEIKIPQIHEYHHKIHKYSFPPVREYSIPEINDYYSHIPQTHINNIPQIQKIEEPFFHETIQEIVQKRPMQPEETINVFIKVLKNKDHLDIRDLIDRLLTIVEENEHNFHPKVLRHLITILNAHKHKNSIPRFVEIILLLLDSLRNEQWPWSERLTELVLSYLLPDKTGNLDSRIVDIILNLYKKQPNEKQIEYILFLLRPFKEGKLDVTVADIILKLIMSLQNNLLRPEYIDILLKILKPHQSGIGDTKEIDIINNLSRWNEMGISPNQLDIVFKLLKPYVNGNADSRPIDILHFLLIKSKYLNPKHIDFILAFLNPENGILDTKRIDIIHFLLSNLIQHPKHVNIILKLLQENPLVLNSRFLEILIFLNSKKLLTFELLETIVELLSYEVAGHLEDNQVKTLFFQLAPYKISNPKIVVDVLTLLNQGGLHRNIVEWLETANQNVGKPSRDAAEPKLHVVMEKVQRHKENLVEQSHSNEYRTPDGGYQTVDSDFMSIFKWLESQGLLNGDQGSNTDLVNKILSILEMGERQLGAVEFTYMLKHEKPLIYQPVYYVKYRLPILSFISNMKSLLLENPHLNTDPMKLLQELIVVSNVTEVSPNLQGYPKEEIMKLTFNDGDLVQAKILDEQNLSLNDQITYVHDLNADISPEEILQLNRINEAKYLPNLVQIKEVPETITVRDINEVVEFPPVHYQQVQTIPEVTHQTHTVHHTYVERTNAKPFSPHHRNA